MPIFSRSRPNFKMSPFLAKLLLETVCGCLYFTENTMQIKFYYKCAIHAHHTIQTWSIWNTSWSNIHTEKMMSSLQCKSDNIFSTDWIWCNMHCECSVHYAQCAWCAICTNTKATDCCWVALYMSFILCHFSYHFAGMTFTPCLY